MDDETIINVLKQWNFWEKDIPTGVRRDEYIKKIYPYLERKEILVLKGIRRCGKSTILKQLMKELIKKGVDKKQILYLNLEDYNLIDDLNIQLFEKIILAYKGYTKNNKKIFFFIDEIQKITGWEKFARTKYDLGEDIKFIVTGSSASLLSKELSTLLTGRNISFKISPLSYEEFLHFSKNKTLEEYLQYGGFPEVVLESSKEKKTVLLQQYFSDIIYKDIIGRYDIRNIKQLTEIARYLVSVSGSKISYNKLSKVFGIDKDSISLYVSYMIDAYLLFEVNYFSYSAKIKHDVTKLPKLYALDNGLINVVNVKYSKNLGNMFENTVLIKLAENFNEISYWGENNSEVNFIVDKHAINVTATDDINNREIKGLDDFNLKYKDFKNILITKNMTNKNFISLNDFLTKNMTPNFKYGQ